MRTEGGILEGKRYWSPTGIYATTPADDLPDVSPFGNNGTFANVTWSQLPSGLWTMVFNGTTSSINHGSSQYLRGSNQFTVLSWVKLSDLTPAGHIIVAKEGPILTTDYEWAFYLYDDDSDNNYHIIFNITDDGNGGNNTHRQFSNCANQVSDTGWHLLVAVMDLSLATTNKVKFFTDAVQGTTTLSAGSWLTSIYKGNADCIIGATERLSGAGWSLKGSIGIPPRLIRAALSPELINAIYAAEKGWFEE